MNSVDLLSQILIADRERLTQRFIQQELAVKQNYFQRKLFTMYFANKSPKKQSDPAGSISHHR